MNEFPLHQLANIDVQYEDNHVIVAVKPPNMLSQADKTGDTDILSQLKEYIKIKYNKPGAVYLGLVHRLDRPVGGLMVFARTSKAASRLSAQMREHEMGREYLCVVEGRVKDRFTCIDYLKKNEYLNKVEICDADEKGAQLAMLSGECLARKNGTALCAIRLQTGRNHQIRVQMANMGAPLWGDNKYGRGIAGQQIALWAGVRASDAQGNHDLPEPSVRLHLELLRRRTDRYGHPLQQLCRSDFEPRHPGQRRN